MWYNNDPQKNLDELLVRVMQFLKDRRGTDTDDKRASRADLNNFIDGIPVSVLAKIRKELY